MCWQFSLPLGKVFMLLVQLKYILCTEQMCLCDSRLPIEKYFEDASLIGLTVVLHVDIH